MGEVIVLQHGTNRHYITGWNNMSRPIIIRPRIRVKFEYIGMAILYPGMLALRVTFIATGATGTMYVRPDALPHKYGME